MHVVFGITPLGAAPKPKIPSGLPALPGALFKLMIEQVLTIEVAVDSMS